MKNNLLYLKILLVISIFILSCNHSMDEEDLSFKPIEADNSSLIAEKQEAQKTAEILFNCFLASQSNNDIQTRSETDMIVELEPIKYKNQTILWIANYPNNSHVILLADKRQFPVASYSTEGHFHYADLLPAEKVIFDMKVEEFYNKMKNDTTSDQQNSLWNALIHNNNLQNNSDTIDITEIEFSISTGDNNEIQTRGYGTIPDRTNSIGYPSVNPLLGHKDRRWSMYWPYDIDMPKGYGCDPYDPARGSDFGTLQLPSLSLCFALVMDYYEHPDPAFWRRQPNAQTEETSTELTKFLKQLAFDFGYDHGVTSNGIPSKHFSSTIVNSMWNKYLYNYKDWEDYIADHASLNSLHSSLTKQRPVIYQPGVRKDINSKGYLPQAYVLDGAQEILVKVIRKKKIFGITISKKTYYFYKDFIHVVHPAGRSYNEWKIYDFIKSDSDNYWDCVFLNLRPR